MTKGEYEFPPQKHTETHVPEDPQEEIQRLRAEIADLEYRAAHPGGTAFKEDLEPEVQKREAELRAFEKSIQAAPQEVSDSMPDHSYEDMQRLRAEIADLEYRAAHPGGTAFKEDLEPEVLKREAELRTLEKGTQTIEQVENHERARGAVLPDAEGKKQPELSFSADPELALDKRHVDDVRGADRTPKEWRTKLAELISHATKKEETSENVIFMQAYLDKRTKEIEAEGEKLDTTNNSVHSVGKKYRSSSWTKKLALVTSLVLSTSASSSMSFPEMMTTLHHATETSHISMEPGTPVPSSRLTMEEVTEMAPAPTPHITMGPITAVPIEMPVIEASPHGYEGMLKQLWTQLHDKHVTLPTNAGAESDLAKLLAADAKTLDGVVHRIAADSRHSFFHTDGTSVRIRADARMTIGPDGNVQLDGSVHAPINAPVTPALHTELPPIEAPSVPSVAENITPSVAPISISPEQVTSSIPSSEIPPVSAEHMVINKFGVDVVPGEPHLYTDKAHHIFVYGGSPDGRMKILVAYVTKNPNVTVFDTDTKGQYRIPWHLVDGKILPEEPVRTRGFFGFGASWMKAPDPSEFRDIIQ
ncbi:MAG TPA: hypothetical protein VMV38_02360 [Candidatus Paceibacterota bacterium]|nr:hypothetical protein [Candidatus Paceibacterota bacterium]